MMVKLAVFYLAFANAIAMIQLKKPYILQASRTMEGDDKALRIERTIGDMNILSFFFKNHANKNIEIG